MFFFVAKVLYFAKYYGNLYFLNIMHLILDIFVPLF